MLALLHWNSSSWRCLLCTTFFSACSLGMRLHGSGLVPPHAGGALSSHLMFHAGEHSTHRCLARPQLCSEVYSTQELQQPAMTHVAFSNRRKTTVCFWPLPSFSSLPTASLFLGKFSMCSHWTGENWAGFHDLFFAAKRSYHSCNQINFSESSWMLFRVCSASLILSWLFFVNHFFF